MLAILVGLHRRNAQWPHRPRRRVHHGAAAGVPVRHVPACRPGNVAGGVVAAARAAGVSFSTTATDTSTCRWRYWWRSGSSSAATRVATRRSSSPVPCCARASPSCWPCSPSTCSFVPPPPLRSGERRGAGAGVKWNARETPVWSSPAGGTNLHRGGARRRPVCRRSAGSDDAADRRAPARRCAASPDLGCGSGVTARTILAPYPEASALLVDFSEPMMAAARVALAARGRHRPPSSWPTSQSAKWTAQIQPHAPFDVARLELRDPPSDRRAQARAVRRDLQLLAPGGLFVNVEHVASADGAHRSDVRCADDRFAGGVPAPAEATAIARAARARPSSTAP